MVRVQTARGRYTKREKDVCAHESGGRCLPAATARVPRHAWRAQVGSATAEAEMTRSYPLHSHAVAVGSRRQCLRELRDATWTAEPTAAGRVAYCRTDVVRPTRQMKSRIIYIKKTIDEVA